MMANSNYLPNNLHHERMVQDFVNRKKELDYLEKLLRDKKEKNIIEVTGIGGIGKTSFVQVAAKRALGSGRFQGGVIWLDCVYLPTLDRILSEISIVLKISREDKRDIRSAIVKYLESRSTLLIFDSFEASRESDEIASFIFQLGRHSKGTKIILVSRNVNRIVRSDFQLRLTGLGFADIVSFFEREPFQKDISFSDELYRKILEFSDGSPLVLSQLKTNLDRGIPIEDILSLGDKAYGDILGNLVDRYLKSSSKDLQIFLYALSIFESPTTLETLSRVADTPKLHSTNWYFANAVNSSLLMEINGRYTLAHSSLRRLIQEQIPVDELRKLEKRFVTAYIPLIRSEGKDLTEEELPNVVKGFRLALEQRDGVAEQYIYAISGYMFSNNQQDEVVKLINNALSNFVVDKESSIFVSLVNIRAVAYMQLNNFDRSISEFQTLLRLEAVKRNPRLSASVLSNLGAAYVRTAQYSNALEIFEQAVNIARKIGDKNSELTNKGNLAVLYNETGQLEKAINSFDQTLMLAHETGNRSAEAIIQGQLARFYEQVNPSKALELYKQQLVLLREIGNRLGELRTLSDIGELYLSRGNFELAEQSFSDTLELSSQLDERELRVHALNRLAEIYRADGDLATTISYASEAIKLAEQLENRIEIVRASIIIGDYHKDLHLYDQAVAVYQRALNILSEDNATQAMTSLYIKLAEVYEAVYEEEGKSEALEAAITNYQCAQTTADELRQEELSVIAQIQMGGLYVKAYHQSGEQKYYQDALVILSRFENNLGNNDFLQAIIQENLGRAYEVHYEHTKENDDLIKAQKHLENAFDLAVSKDNLAKWLIIAPMLSKVYFELNQKVNWKKIWEFGTQSLKSVSRNADPQFVKRVASVLVDCIQVATKKGDHIAALRQLLEISDYFQNSQLKTPDSVQLALNNLRSSLGEERFSLLYADANGKLTSGIASLLEESRTLMGNSQFESAVQRLGEALTFLVDDNKEDYKRQKATILYLRGICLREQQLWDIALKDQEMAFELYANLRDLAGQAHVLLEIGFLYEFMNSYEDARLHYTDAYRLYKKIANKGGMANAVEHLGMLEFRVRMYLQAVENLEEARSLYTELGERDKANRLEIDLIDARAGLQQQGSNLEEKP